jgi:hypothetical protein
MFYENQKSIFMSESIRILFGFKGRKKNPNLLQRLRENRRRTSENWRITMMIVY